MEKVKMLKVGA